MKGQRGRADGIDPTAAAAASAAPEGEPMLAFVSIVSGRRRERYSDILHLSAVIFARRALNTQRGGGLSGLYSSAGEVLPATPDGNV